MTKATARLDDWVIIRDDSLADSSDLDFDPVDWNVANVTMHTLIVGAACDVKYLVATGGDFTSPDVNVTIDSPGSAGIITDIAIPIQQSTARVRLTNTSGGAAAFAGVGTVRVSDGEGL